MSHILRSIDASPSKFSTPIKLPKLKSSASQDERTSFQDFKEFVHSNSQITNHSRKSHAGRKLRVSQILDSNPLSDFDPSPTPQKFTLPSIDQGHLNDQELPQGPTAQQEAIKRNLRINKAIHKTRKKLKFIGGGGEAERFDERMQIFRGLNTFIDAKDIIQNMNALNKLNKAEATVQMNLRDQLRDLSKEMQSQKSPEGRKMDKLNTKIINALEKARVHILDQQTYAKRASKLHNSFGYHLSEATDDLLYKFQQRSYDPVEKDDLDNFDEKLGKDLLSGKLDVLEVPEAFDQEKITHGMKNLQCLLEEKTKLSLARDQRYHEHYKKRADNVVAMVTKTAQKIFARDNDKESEKKKSVGNLDKVRSIRKKTKEFLDEPVQDNETVSESQSHEPIFTTDFDIERISTNDQITETRSKLNSFETVQGRSGRSGSMDFILNKKWVKLNQTIVPSPPTDNKKVNNHHRCMATEIINEIESHEYEFQDLKLKMSKEIEQLEEFLQQDIEKLKEDPKEVFRVDIDTTGHFASFSSKPLRLPSKKKLAAVLGF